MKCEYCKNNHNGSYGSGRFCSQKCARGYSSNLKRDEVNKKVSKKLKGTSPPNKGKKYPRKDYDFICNKCGISYKKNLSIDTQYRKQYNPVCDSCRQINRSNQTKKFYKNKLIDAPFSELGHTLKRRRIWVKQQKKCNHCEFNKYPLEGGPYELHHKDGNSQNSFEENLEILCCNCHFMTDNFGFKNKTHSEDAKRVISVRSKEYQKSLRE